MGSKGLKDEEEEEYQGDLTDILRAACSRSGEWRFPSTGLDHHEQTSLPLGFGNPFGNTRDPLLHALSPATFFVPPAPSNSQIITPTATASNHNNIVVASNRFSTTGTGGGASSVNSGDTIINANTSAGQISSPRNPGVKRRKRQASKVVCIPAPALVNSRPTGEVVPSDLWAWRKYGQKPIKGSPHPRGYYRCSSSKGCSARKQVERSRTDPNMLVITYTSDHNHPWPTQRNALAGSTRKPTSMTPSPSPILAKEEDDEISITNTITADDNNNNNTAVKEESTDLNPQLFDDYDTEIGLMPISSSQLTCEDSFFAELGEIEADMLFTKAFTPSDHDHHLLKDQKTKGSHDHHSTLFDWSEENKGL